MAKIAQYYLEYLDNYQPDLFEKSRWSQRQDIFGELFEKDTNIEFKVGEKVFHHRTYHLVSNPNIIVMRFANVKDIIVEHDFKEQTVRSNPSCFVIIDNRKGCRRIGIQKLHTSFSSTGQVAKILERVINERMDAEHHIGVQLHAQRYPKAFYDLWRMKEQTTVELKFSTSVMEKVEAAEKARRAEQMPDTAADAEGGVASPESLSHYIDCIGEEAHSAGYSTTIGLTPIGGGVMLVDEKNPLVKALVKYSASTGAPIQLITKDGTSYRCYVEEDCESTDKIVTHNIDTQLLDQLFDPSIDDKLPVEARLVESVNGMKHVVDDKEKEEVA